MSAHTSSKLRHLRIGTALATGIIGILQGQAALAQTIPDIPNNTFPTISGPGTTADGAQVSTSGTTMTVNLTSSGGTTDSRNMVWSNYQIGENNTVSYVSNVDTNPLVALNRVTSSANISVIEGQITSESHIAVWLINPQGIMFNSGSSFSGGALILSTLTPRDLNPGNPNEDDDLNIIDGTGAVELGLSNGDSSDLTGAIAFASGSSITSSGRVALIGQQIEMNGAIDADGDVGLILAQGISMSSSTASPLTYTIQGGTKLDGSDVGEATAQLLVGGSITGANVKLYAVSEDAITGALLQVDSGSLLKADAVGGSVVLRVYNDGAGTANLVSNGAIEATSGGVSITALDDSSSADGDVTVAGTLTTTDGGNLTVSGNEVTLGGVSAVTQTIDGAATITSGNDNNIITTASVTFATGGDATFDASGDAELASTLTIGGALTVTGDAVTLGNGTDSKLQQAAGDVSVTATNGDLTISTGISLNSTGGTILLDGQDSGSDVIIRGKAISDGDLTINSDRHVLFGALDNSTGDGSVVSATGNVVIDAAGSVSGIAGTVPTTLRGIYGYDVTGDLAINSTGDVLASGLKAGGNLSLGIDGALLGAPTSQPATLASGLVKATSGSVTITAGNNEIVVLEEVQASAGITIHSDTTALGTVKLGSGNLLLTDVDNTPTTYLEINSSSLALPASITDYYIGTLTKTGNLTVTAAGTPAITNVVSTADDGAFDSDHGKAALTATSGSVTGTVANGAQLGAVNAGSLIDLTAGGILADSTTSAGTTDLRATAGTLAVGTVNSGDTLVMTKLGGVGTDEGDELRLTSGTVASGDAQLTSSTHVRVGSLTTTLGAITLNASNGDISGLQTGTFGALDLVSTANALDSEFDSANLTASAGPVDVNATQGGVQLGTVSAGTDANISGKAVSLGTVTTQQDATISASEGTLVLDSVSVGRNALITKSLGSLATPGDDLRITTAVVSGNITPSGTTTVTSSTSIDAGAIESTSSTVDITATSGDVKIGNRVYGGGNVTINAGRDFIITPYTATPSQTGYVQSAGGSVLIDAGHSVYGIGESDTVLPVTAGTVGGIHIIGNLDVSGVGDIFMGTLSATGAITFSNLSGGVYGTSGSAGADLPAGAVFAAGDITVNANAINVLNRAEAGGNLTLSGDKVAIGTPLAGGTTTYLDEIGNALLQSDLYLGVQTITPFGGTYFLTPTSPVVYNNLIAQENILAGPNYGPEKFETAVGKTNLAAGGAISGTISGAAQLGTVSSGDAITLTVGALVADSITVAADGLDITATTGTLSVLDANVSGAINLTKNGGTNVAGDDLRLFDAVAGGSISLTSNTSIRVGNLQAGGGAITLTATNGDISGMRTGTWGLLPTASGNTVLSADFDQADLTSSDAITVTAANGSVQLGSVAAAGAITADAAAFVADALTATGSGGLIDVNVTSGSLNVGTTNAASTTSLVKTGAGGAIRFDSITGPGVTISSSTDVIGTGISSIGGFVSINAGNDITIDTIDADSLSAVASHDAEYQTITTLNTSFTSAFNDITVGSVTSNSGAAQVRAGRNVTVTTSISGATIGEGWAGIIDTSGLLKAPSITSTASAIARSGGNAEVDVLSGGSSATVNVGGSYTGTSITSTLGSISLTAGGDVAIDTGTAATNITGTVGSLHAISLSSSGGGVSINATTGDIAGKLSGTAGALPTTTTGTSLSSDYGKLNVLASGGVALTAANGAMQLGTVTNGGDFSGSAKAITIDSATPGGLLSLTATSGTLYVGSAEAGLSLTLTKQGTDDELRFGTLESGNFVGGTSGAATLTSSTDIRGTSITARGGSISVAAANGEVTGLASGRLALSAQPDLDGLGDPVAGTDTGTITVTSGLLSRLGNVRAGSNIAITAGVSGSATLGGAIDVLDVTSAGGNIDLLSYNDGIATNGISYEDLSGQRIWVRAFGTASGDIGGQTANGANLYTYAETGGVTVTNHTSTGYVYLIAGGGDVDAGVVDAGNNIAYLFASNNTNAISVNSDTEVYLLADNNVDVGAATSGTSLIGNAGNDFALQSGAGAASVDLTSGNDMQLGSLSSSGGHVVLNAGGDVTGANGFTTNAAQRPDITAATYIDIVAAGSVELDTATALGGNLTARAGNATTDGSIDINNASASGLIELVATATGTADDSNHNGTVRVDTAQAGTTLTLSNVLLGGTLGDVIVDTSATAGFGALATATGNDARFDAAENARIESATALTGTIAVRAGDAIGASNLAQGADLNAGEDLALKAGSGINLGTASAGDDLILESTDTITVGNLTATGTNAALDNRTVSFASPMSIAIAGPETNLGASIVVRSSAGSVNSNGTLTAANGSVTIEAADEASITGNVDAGINYTVKAVNNITLGGNSAATQSAKGAVQIESTSGDILDGTGAVDLIANSDGIGTETLTVTAPGDILINSVTLIGGDGNKQSDVLLTTSGGEISIAGIDAARLIASAVEGFTATAPISVGSAANPADAAAGPSTVDIKVTAGNIVADDITTVGAGHDIRLTASGSITTGALSAARSVIVNGVTAGSASGAFSADSLSSTAGPIDIKATSITVTNATSSASTLTLNATSGNLALGTASSNGAMSLTSSGAISATSLTSTGGGITGTGASIAVTGATTAGGPLNLSATSGALTLGTASSNGAMTLNSTGALGATSLTSTGGEINATGGSVNISGAANAGGPLTLTATSGNLDLGSASASGAVALKASGTITAGAVNAGGNTVILTANDAALNGTITGSTITVANGGGASNAFRIGDNPEGTGGFALDAAEVNRLSAATVVLDAGTGTGLTANDVKIGDLALTNATLQTLEINARLRVDLNGSLTKGVGSGVTLVRIGGTSTVTDLATVIRIAALGDGTGGLIDLGSAGLELRGAKIGMGQDAGFLDLIGIGPNASATPLDARLMVSNPASSLYNSTALGGTTYQAGGQVVIRANTMVVRYSDFALFQNTGLPGANEGVRLASTASPQIPALRIIGPASPVGGPFGMFGEINGFRDTATALLGDAVINVVSVDRTSARINGCLIGSGAGCLTTLAITPILGTFDPVRGSIFYANADFELPFDPLVGTNNDSLFGDVGTFGLEDIPLDSIECADDKAGAQCTKPNGEQK